MAKRFEKANELTKKYKDRLNPCQHCGNRDIRIVSDRTMFPAKYGWSVCCATDKCDCTGVYTSVKEAVEAWNRRENESD